MRSTDPRDFPSLFLVCMAIMASRFSTDGGNGPHVSFKITYMKNIPVSSFSERIESSSPGNHNKNKVITHTYTLSFHLKAASTLISSFEPSMLYLDDSSELYNSGGWGGGGSLTCC